MSSWPIEAVISTSALGGIEPDSRTSQPSTSARWRSSSSATRRITAIRSVNGVAAHSRWAPAADAVARATASASAAPAVPSTSPVAGSIVSIVSGASTHPSLKIFPSTAIRPAGPRPAGPPWGRRWSWSWLMLLSRVSHATSVAASAGLRSLIRSAAFSAIMIVGALVLPRVIVGITDASTTRSPVTP